MPEDETGYRYYAFLHGECWSVMGCHGTRRWIADGQYSDREDAERLTKTETAKEDREYDRDWFRVGEWRKQPGESEQDMIDEANRRLTRYEAERAERRERARQPRHPRHDDSVN